LLLAALVARGCHIAFPRVAGRDLALQFHRVPDGEMLRAAAYGIQEPAPHFPAAVPDLLLMPLLAFDTAGHRLGYGGGFYDRTLAALNIPAIGIAFAGQEVSSIPAEPHDRRLDGILSEHGLKRFT
jgi:5-formyltetrahydrofolate cyclo-ligase